MQTDSAKYEFVLDNLYFAHIDGPEVQKGKVNVTLNVKRTSRAFELSFQTDGMVWVPCDRCLDDMELPISSSDLVVWEIYAIFVTDNYFIQRLKQI